MCLHVNQEPGGFGFPRSGGWRSQWRSVSSCRRDSRTHSSVTGMLGVNLFSFSSAKNPHQWLTLTGADMWWIQEVNPLFFLFFKCYFVVYLYICYSVRSLIYQHQMSSHCGFQQATTVQAFQKNRLLLVYKQTFPQVHVACIKSNRDFTSECPWCNEGCDINRRVWCCDPLRSLNKSSDSVFTAAKLTVQCITVIILKDKN